MISNQRCRGAHGLQLQGTPRRLSYTEKLAALYRKEAYWVVVLASQYKKWGCAQGKL